MAIYTLEEIVILRKYLRLSIEEFWRYLDLTKQTGYNLEKGKTKMSRSTAIAATKILQYLYLEDGENIEEILDEYDELKMYKLTERLLELVK